MDTAVLAHLSGPSTFKGRQLHVADYVSAEEFRGLHVIVVGGGISAVGLLDEIPRVTSTSWFTRREPVWREAEFDSKAGHDAVALWRSACGWVSVPKCCRCHRTPLDAASARGCGAGRPGAASPVQRHRAQRRPVGGRRIPRRRCDPFGHWLPRQAGTSRTAAPARPGRRDRRERHPGGGGTPRAFGGLRPVVVHRRRQPHRTGSRYRDS